MIRLPPPPPLALVVSALCLYILFLCIDEGNHRVAAAMQVLPPETRVPCICYRDIVDANIKRVVADGEHRRVRHISGTRTAAAVQRPHAGLRHETLETNWSLEAATSYHQK